MLGHVLGFRQLESVRRVCEPVWMRAHTVTVVLVGLVGLGATARADDPSPLDRAEKLTIEDILKVAIRVAPDLQSAAFDVSTARAAKQTVLGVEDLLLSVDNSNTIAQLPASKNRVITGDTKLSRVLPTNGTVTVGATLSDSSFIEPRATNQFATVDLSVILSQPLLAGAGSVVEKAPILQADHTLSAVTIRRTAVARTFVAQVVAAYWHLALAWRRLDVVHLSLTAAEKQLATIQRGLTTGALAKSEAVPFAESIASHKIDIANAESDIIAQSLALRVLVGLELPPDAPAIRTIDLPRATVAPIDTADLVKRALATSDQLHAALEDVRSAEAGMAAADRNLLPSLNLSVEGDVIGTHETVALAVDSLRYDPGYSVVFGASFALPIGNRTAKGTYATNRVAVARARFSVYSQRKQIAGDVIGLANSANTAARTVALSEEVVALAQQNVESEQRKYELGKSTSNDVVLRQTELDAARLELESANADAMVALANIEAETNVILQHYGIHMVDPDSLTELELGRK